MKSLKIKKFKTKEFDEKLKDIRNLEAQLHHQNEMYRRPLQNKRKDIILDILKNNLKGNSFLDVGCAEGLFNHYAYENGSTYSVGIDISETKIETAKREFPNCTFHKFRRSIIAYRIAILSTYSFETRSLILQDGVKNGSARYQTD